MLLKTNILLKSLSLLRSQKILFLLMLMILSGCNRIETKDITIIDGVTLGKDENLFYSDLDSLNIKRVEIYSKIIFNDLSELEASTIVARKTNIFDFSAYQSEYVHNYGIYQPIKLTGTNNIIGLNIILTHTDHALSFGVAGFFDATDQTKISGVSQDLPIEQINEIEKLLINKYGPTTDTSRLFNNFWVLEGRELNGYTTDAEYSGYVLKWETKYVDVKLFKGVKAPQTIFKSKTRSYSYLVKDKNPDASQGELACNSYSFISYQLNDKAIEKLKLDKLNL